MQQHRPFNLNICSVLVSSAQGTEKHTHTSSSTMKVGFLQTAMLLSETVKPGCVHTNEQSVIVFHHRINKMLCYALRTTIKFCLVKVDPFNNEWTSDVLIFNYQ